MVVTHACWPHAAGGGGDEAGGTALGLLDARHGRPVARLARASRRAIPPDLVLVHSDCTAATLPRLFPGVAWEVLRYPVAARPLDRAERGGPCARAGGERRRGGGRHHLPAGAVEGPRAADRRPARLRDHPGWTAWIAGGAQRPHERAYLEGLRGAAANSGSRGGWRFLGDRRDVPRLLAAADIHCQPNLGPEPFGIAFVEALYAGLPVVSTRLGGAAEIVTEACGVLVAPGDPAALATALGSLIADPEARRLARPAPRGPRRCATRRACSAGSMSCSPGWPPAAGAFAVSRSRSESG